MKELWSVTQMVFTALGGFCGWFLGGIDGFDVSLRFCVGSRTATII